MAEDNHDDVVKTNDDVIDSTILDVVMDAALPEEEKMPTTLLELGKQMSRAEAEAIIERNKHRYKKPMKPETIMNLKPMVKGSDRAKEIMAKARKNSDHSKREKKFMTNVIETVLKLSSNDTKFKKAMEEMGFSGKVTQGMEMVFGMVNEAKTNPIAFKEIMDRVEGKQMVSTNVTAKIGVGGIEQLLDVMSGTPSDEDLLEELYD
jgi:hypothetical protein